MYTKKVAIYPNEDDNLAYNSASKNLVETTNKI
jgi:hypothetical protein